MLEVLRLQLKNSLRNFNYLIWDRTTQEAAAIDPLDVAALLVSLREKQLNLKYIINTHEHHDHTAGNIELAAATAAVVLAPESLRKVIPAFGQGLQAGDEVYLGHEKISVLATPGHTMGHISLFYESEQPMLFSGDTLFNAGVGNCYHGGDVNTLFETFEKIIFKLPRNTLLYPGHDYLENNLKFAASLLPHDEYILADLSSLNQGGSILRTLADEFRSNIFFRLDDAAVHKALAARGYAIKLSSAAREVFFALRLLRDDW